MFNFADLDRKQRSRYATVLTRAHKAESKPSDAAQFVSWLNATGGIVAAIEQKNEASNSKPSQAVINANVRSLPSLATVSIPNSGNRFVVLLAQGIDSNTVEVLYEIEDDVLSERIAARVLSEVTKAKKAEQPTAEKIAEAVKQQAISASKEVV